LCVLDSILIEENSQTFERHDSLRKLQALLQHAAFVVMFRPFPVPFKHRGHNPRAECQSGTMEKAPPKRSLPQNTSLYFTLPPKRNVGPTEMRTLLRELPRKPSNKNVCTKSTPTRSPTCFVAFTSKPPPTP
jgi:hypothetical protein